MNYYYDIILNWNEEKMYDFYEWNDTDYLELIKKIPIFRVKHKTLVDLMSNKVKVDQDFMNLIKDKTLINGKNIINKINYAALFTDNKNCVAIEFNTNKESVNYSKLLVDDEINVLEIAYSLKEYPINYEIIEKFENRKILRQEAEAKRLISLEINNLYQNKELAKLRYLYYEYKKEKIQDIEYIFHHILSDLNQDLNKDILKLYYIIKLSYHNV